MSKVVLITGGSSGIGKSIGTYLTLKGYKVYGTSRTPKNTLDSNFPIITLDVTKPETIVPCITSVLDKENRIDVLINNAGVGITGPVEEIPEEAIKAHFETNFFGPIAVINAILPQMRKQQDGLIINITSIAGFMGLPYRGIYSASKSALGILTETYRMELKAFNIKMATIAPGDFATNIASGRYHAPLITESPYYLAYDKALKSIDDDVDNGSAPILMAKKVHQVIELKHPKVHYKVGTFMQKFSVVLKAVLPSKVYEKLLLNHYKL